MQKRAHEEAESRGEMQIGISPYIKNKAPYASFITAQVKVWPDLLKHDASLKRPDPVDDVSPGLSYAATRSARDY